MKACVYLITNLVNGKLYVGKTINPKGRFSEHVGESRRAQPRMILAYAIRKYGASNFKFEVLETRATEEEALTREAWWVAQLGSNLPGKGYNIDPGGLGGRALSLSTKQKIAKAHIGMRATEETRAKLSASHLGKKRTPEAIEKGAAALRGRPRSPDVIAKATSARKWEGHSAESRAKMSASRTGKSLTTEHKAHIASAHRGMKRSPEAVARMTVAQRLRREREQAG